MASAVSKRQQARNEKALQDLIKNVSGNDRCADCAARNPGWASWSLGIFLCMRCAALHRKVGTHVTKVKSLSMDSWNTEQVEHMKRVGNANSNRSFNPQGVKPAIPVDADEVEGVMERYIRQKYEQKHFSGGDIRHTARQNTGSTTASSAEDQPPPLPPKTGRKFGFMRSASSTYPQPQRTEKYTPPLSPALSGSDGRASPKVNKQSRVFGSNIGNQDESFDMKLAALREMGFHDMRRASTVLKSMNGNLDRTVESLVRLGSLGSLSEVSKPPSRTLTPVSAGSASASTSGITVEKRKVTENAPSSQDPFEALDNPPPQRAVTSPLPQLQTQPYGQTSSWNPFQAQAARSQHLQNSFQGLQISQSSQTPQNNGYNPFMPIPQAQAQQIPQDSNAVQPYGYGAAPAQSTQQNAPFDSASNPFLRQSQSQTFASSNPYVQQQQQQQQLASSHPWAQPQQTVQTPQSLYQPQPDFFTQQSGQFQSQTPDQNYTHVNGGAGNPFYSQQQPQQQPQQQQNQQYQQYAQPTQAMTPSNPYQPAPPLPQQSSTPSNPYQQFAAPNQYQPQPQHQPQQQQYFQEAQQAQPFRHDKSSILALYGQQSTYAAQQLHSLPEDPTQSALPNAAQDLPPMPRSGLGQRSATMPPALTGFGAPAGAGARSLNPFAASQLPPSSTAAAAANNGVVAGPRHVSQESVDFVNLGGRQSPDAFKGLSARYT